MLKGSNRRIFFLNKILFVELFFLFVSFSVVYPQSLPDYSDRKVFLYDSSKTISSTIAISDGEIDENEFYVGPGDVFLISIIGLEEKIFRGKISLDYKLHLPLAGFIDLTDLTLVEAKSQIEKAILREYKNVRVFISLDEIRRIKVTLSGDVVKPKTYSLFANSRLVDLITISEGVNKTANLREISITDKNGNKKFYDLVRFTRLGDKKQNPYLREGDFVFIDLADKSVSILGAVKFPGTYEYIKNQKLSELILFSGGFLAKAKTDSIEIIRFKEDNKTQYSLFISKEEIETKDFTLMNKDKVVIRDIPEYLKDNSILIEGFVKYPGVYSIIDNKTTLTEIIQRAGGFTDKASLFDATLERRIGTESIDPEFERLKLIPRQDMTDDEYDYYKSKSRSRSGKVVVDFFELFVNKNIEEDITLRRNDKITVPEKKNYIIMIGQVVNPGAIEFKEGLTYSDYIKLAGGYGWRALKSDVRIVKVNSGEWIDADDDIVLQPGDTIWIPEDPPGPKFWDLTKDILFILGQVATVVAAVIAVIVSSR